MVNDKTKTDRPSVARTCSAVPAEDATFTREGYEHPRDAIPRGTYGVTLVDDDAGCSLVDFGPPWGAVYVEHHYLVDAQAVLLNAVRAIRVLKRPWRAVIRRTLRTMGGPYLVLAAGGPDDERIRGAGTFVVEAYLRDGNRKKAIALLQHATNIAGGKAGA